MIIDCVSDLHGFYPKLDGGDLLIVAGDLTSHDYFNEYCYIFQHISRAPYKKRVLIGGNHDNLLQQHADFFDLSINFSYLQDSGTEFEGLKIWGSPWTKTFEGMNPLCKAFTVDTEEELEEKWKLIPRDTNILITHSPSFGNYDWVKKQNGSIGASVGSITLWMTMLTMVPNLKLHVTGHIHEANGESLHTNGIHLVNASHVNERYQPVNKPIRVIL
jgi:predicted phosphodiesterase